MLLKKQNLKTKGWTDKEIQHAEEILTRAEEKKHPQLLFVERFTFWLLFLFVIISALTIVWIIEPIILFTSVTTGFIFVAVGGLLFGSFASMLIRTIEKIEIKHHLIMSLIIPLSAVISSLILTHKVNLLATGLNLNSHDPYIFATVFALSSFIPYIFYLYIERKKDYGTL